MKDRLRAANDIIVCLEKKIVSLTEWAGRQTDTAGMLKKLRDGTCQELNKYKKEAGQLYTYIFLVFPNRSDKGTFRIRNCLNMKRDPEKSILPILKSYQGMYIHLCDLSRQTRMRQIIWSFSQHNNTTSLSYWPLTTSLFLHSCLQLQLF